MQELLDIVKHEIRLRADTHLSDLRSETRKSDRNLGDISMLVGKMDECAEITHIINKIHAKWEEDENG